jgi:type I restriction enzyme, S subunit
MSRLEELIQRYCPDGVEYKALKEVATDWYRGAGIKRDEVSEDGIPCIRYGEIHTTYHIWFDKCVSHTDESQQPSKKYADYGDILFAITSEDIPFVGNSVAYLGKERILVGGDIVVMKHRQNPKYLAYALLTTDAVRQKGKGKVKSKVVHTSVPSLQEIVVPIPPMPVQEEIVRILDSFTELQAELQAELQKRKQQYNYYLDNLLSFNNINRGGHREEVRWMKMSEVFEIRNGYTPSKANKEFWEGGTIPWFRMEDIRQNGRILSDSILHITPKGIKGKGLFKANSFIIATTATIGEHALLIADSLANQRFTNLQIRKSLEKELSVKFFFYYLYMIDDWCKANTNVSSFASVDMVKFNNLLIPIPPLAEQERIVSILDRFDKLTNDLTTGLPAEIEKRQQQYEYYRDRLLNFKRIDA